MANSSIDLVGLDFDSLKSSLKTYLKARPEFKDYDFEGSNINVLLDILAYNSYHQSYYLSMVLSESYIDSAQLRNSMVSHAKELNYLPRSARSARAEIDLNFSSNTNVVTIPRGTSFTATVGSNLHTFLTDDESVHFSSNGTFSVPDLAVYEGRMASERYVVNYNVSVQRFLINDPTVDTRSIRVSVTEDGSTTPTTYVWTTTTLGLGAGSQVFFLQAAEDGKYEVIFGDDILGRRPKDNSVVSISYRTCTEAAGNGASRFYLDSAFTTFTSTPTVETSAVARGGASVESIDSIRFYAPRYFQVQERAVNVSDYEIMLRQRFPEINALAAYGGEDLDPPQFGKVFISVDISDVDGLPESKVREYREFLRDKVPLSIDTEFVEPEFLFFDVATSVKYSVTGTDLNAEQVRSLVANRIITYTTDELNDFKASFLYSRFVGVIDDITQASIISNDTDIRIYRRVVPTFGTSVDLQVGFGVPLTEEGSVLPTRYHYDDFVAVRSSPFVLGGETVHIDDDGSGVLRIVKDVLNEVVVVIPSVGSVDYSTGFLSMTNIRIDGLEAGEQYVRFYGRTAARDFETRENVILDLEADRMRIEVVPVRESQD